MELSLLDMPFFWQKDALKVWTFTPNVKLVLSENLGGILGGTQC
jgi:hypothetical protein